MTGRVFLSQMCEQELSRAHDLARTISKHLPRHDSRLDSLLVFAYCADMHSHNVIERMLLEQFTMQQSFNYHQK